MNNFKLHTPTRILFGKGAIVDLRDQNPAGRPRADYLWRR
ncbi:alcohol dehydrogenase [Salmonella enterica subsp. enterica]|uniref:Alcohol dehydrogenase n=1 Tax=Salmonella enterica I TaxID=59201 RepID=A0A379UUY7_SALET|nr:alcohol dehydrogenase [Salmonella enterica subsp. enterica]